MYAAGARTFVEVGPGTVLTALVGRILGERPHLAVATDARKDGGVAGFLATVGALAANGHALELPALLAALDQPDDPEARHKPKLAVSINGANTGKPYPPAGGAADLPPPNPPRAGRGAAAAGPVSASPSSRRRSRRHPPRPVARRRRPRPRPPRPLFGDADHVPDPQAGACRAQPVAAAPAMVPTAQLAWVQAYADVQRQTAEAHAAPARMADSHAAFLQAAETGFAGLAAMMTGQPVQVAQRVAAPAPQPVISAPRPGPDLRAGPGRAGSPADLRAAPVAPAPQPTFAPAPVAAAPVAPAPVAAARLAGPGRRPRSRRPRPRPAGADAGRGGRQDGLPRRHALHGHGSGGRPRRGLHQAGGDPGRHPEAAPGLPEVDNSQLAELRTLGQIAEVLGATGAPPLLRPRPWPPPLRLGQRRRRGPRHHRAMLEVVADKTGYPADMLSMDMDLEGDLGVDSIKRVEILGAVQEAAPELPELEPSALAELRTLGRIADALGAADAAPVHGAAAPAAAAPARPRPRHRASCSTWWRTRPATPPTCSPPRWSEGTSASTPSSGWRSSRPSRSRPRAPPTRARLHGQAHHPGAHHRRPAGARRPGVRGRAPATVRAAAAAPRPTSSAATP